MVLTISQILNQYSGFEKAFWATYSIDFGTVNFLLKKDFKQIMNPCYFHLICDCNKLDESISKTFKETKDLSNLSKLQEYATISSQFTDGAFHPKILFFASESEKKLLCIISSANATSSGILSNQDLIGLYYYDEDHTEYTKELCAIFKYLSNFPGWGVEAEEDLKVIENAFNFLSESQSTENVLTIPNESNLIFQIKNSLTDIDKIQNINIFSPFFDENFQAISEIEHFFNKPINIFSSQKQFQTSRTSTLPKSIKFFSSGTEKRKCFHAKFYEFNYGEESTIFWGSANCSFSGLLSNDRNYEVLIRSKMSRYEIQELWGALSEKEESTVAYNCEIADNKNNKETKDLYIYKVTTSHDGFTVQLSRPLANETIVGIKNNGMKVKMNVKSTYGDDVTVTCDEKGLVILYVSDGENIVSNMIYINNPFSIKARILGGIKEPDFDPKNINSENSINHAFSYFNLKTDGQKPVPTKGTKVNRGFWQLPQFISRSNSYGLINLEDFINGRIIKFKEKEDEDNFNNNNLTKTRKYEKAHKNTLNRISREVSKLLKNIIIISDNEWEDNIDSSRWLLGIDILNHFILDYLDKQESFNDLEQLRILLRDISIVSTWIILNIYDDSVDETRQYRLELVNSVIYLFLSISLYDLIIRYEYKVGFQLGDEDFNLINKVKKGIHLLHNVREATSLTDHITEHSQYTYKSFISKLRINRLAKLTISTINNRRICKIAGLENIYSCDTPKGSMLYLKDKGNFMDVESILGIKKKLDINLKTKLKRLN